MSNLSTQLLRVKLDVRTTNRWRQRFTDIVNILVREYDVPTLGNFRDPVTELLYIVLSAKTAEKQYQSAHNSLMRKFPSLTDLASADVREILDCIETAGLGAKRATQLRQVAETILSLGSNPEKVLREMSAAQVFHFFTSLQGVGIKSAFCVMMYSLDHDVFPVDVNVRRLASRLGAIRIGGRHYNAQRELPGLVPDGRSKELHITMVVHGRKICKPHRPLCDSCVIASHCAHIKRSSKKV